jgi:hypothetical protein
MVGRGGIRPHLDYVATERWGWRVAMAQTLLPHEGPCGRSLNALARGKLSRGVVLAVVASLLSGQLRPKAAAGMLLASLWWPRSGKRTAR